MSTSQTSNREQSASREALINESIERILAQPLVHPPFDLSEACFHGQLDANGNKAGRVKVRILRALRSKSGSGSDQILVEGVVTATYKLDCPPSQYPKDNPEGWDVIAYGETKTEVPVLDATGEPMYETDANGIEIVNPDGSLSEHHGHVKHAVVGRHVENGRNFMVPELLLDKQIRCGFEPQDRLALCYQHERMSCSPGFQCGHDGHVTLSSSNHFGDLQSLLPIVIGQTVDLLCHVV
jgi:hypothetical protein